MSLRFAVVHEAKADFDTATELADRVLLETFDWLEEESLSSQRMWVAEEPEGCRLTWKAVKRLAEAAGIRVRGHFDGAPGEPDARAARRAILYLLWAVPDLDAILLIRDQDDQPERRVGLEQARAQNHGWTVIVVGLAVVERECWVISGFDPRDEDESARLNTERATLGFDPRMRSHELTACKDDNARRSPKRVLRGLCEEDWHRERHCWAESSLERLRERGGENGLSAYLHEIRDRVAPLLGPVAQERPPRP